MSSLADEVEAGGGTDEAVALALGICPHKEVRRETWEGENDYLEHSYYCKACGVEVTGKWPRVSAFLTNLNALAAECGRRGWRYWVNTSFGQPLAGVWSDRPQAYEACSNTPARALCAAIIRAVESEAAAIRGDTK